MIDQDQASRQNDFDPTPVLQLGVQLSRENLDHLHKGDAYAWIGDDETRIRLTPNQLSQLYDRLAEGHDITVLEVVRDIARHGQFITLSVTDKGLAMSAVS